MKRHIVRAQRRHLGLAGGQEEQYHHHEHPAKKHAVEAAPVVRKKLNVKFYPPSAFSAESKKAWLESRAVKKWIDKHGKRGPRVFGARRQARK